MELNPRTIDLNVNERATRADSYHFGPEYYYLHFPVPKKSDVDSLALPTAVVVNDSSETESGLKKGQKVGLLHYIGEATEEAAQSTLGKMNNKEELNTSEDSLPSKLEKQVENNQAMENQKENNFGSIPKDHALARSVSDDPCTENSKVMFVSLFPGTGNYLNTETTSNVKSENTGKSLGYQDKEKKTERDAFAVEMENNDTYSTAKQKVYLQRCEPIEMINVTSDYQDKQDLLPEKQVSQTDISLGNGTVEKVSLGIRNEDYQFMTQIQHSSVNPNVLTDQTEKNDDTSENASETKHEVQQLQNEYQIRKLKPASVEEELTILSLDASKPPDLIHQRLQTEKENELHPNRESESTMEAQNEICNVDDPYNKRRESSIISENEMINKALQRNENKEACETAQVYQRGHTNEMLQDVHSGIVKDGAIVFIKLVTQSDQTEKKTNQINENIKASKTDQQEDDKPINEAIFQTDTCAQWGQKTETNQIAKERYIITSEEEHERINTSDIKLMEDDQKEHKQNINDASRNNNEKVLPQNTVTSVSNIPVKTGSVHTETALYGESALSNLNEEGAESKAKAFQKPIDPKLTTVTADKKQNRGEYMGNEETAKVADVKKTFERKESSKQKAKHDQKSPKKGKSGFEDE
nr:PREDICTED: probable inactive protein kinase DDB_G0270444 [Latimeria chalumnae]|eukprot:XP_014350134.1 PREDICTED: probable inactive protein kinase DDB_G0270444 [Latimeria chalumnae]